MKCPHCTLEFDKKQIANHVRWCTSNPKYNEYKESLRKTVHKARAARLEKPASNHFIKARQLGLPVPKGVKHKGGTGYKHTDDAKRIMSEKALSSTHRRLVRSIRKYIKKDGSVVILDSSWEEKLAERLDFLNIEWTRPDKPIRYILNDKEHSYFPDFFLVDFNLFLDPKNPEACRQQKEKMDIVKNMLPNLIILYNINEIENFSPSTGPGFYPEGA